MVGKSKGFDYYQGSLGYKHTHFFSVANEGYHGYLRPQLFAQLVLSGFGRDATD